MHPKSKFPWFPVAANSFGLSANWVMRSADNLETDNVAVAAELVMTAVMSYRDRVQSTIYNVA